MSCVAGGRRRAMKQLLQLRRCCPWEVRPAMPRFLEEWEQAKRARLLEEVVAQQRAHAKEEMLLAEARV